MGREDRLVGIGHPLAQHGDQLEIFLRHRVADGVGDIDRGGARLDRGFDAAAQEIMLGAGAVFRRPFHIVGVAARPGHRRDHRFIDLFRLHLQLVLHVHRAGGQEAVDARALGVFQGIGRTVDILLAGPRQAADHRVLDDLGDFGDRLEIAIGGDRESPPR